MKHNKIIDKSSYKNVKPIRYKYYKQVGGVVMGFQLGPALANIFMCSFERNGFEIVRMISKLCSIYVMLMAFVLFSSPDHAGQFKEYLSL